LNPRDVQQLLIDGVDQTEIVRRLIETGSWSDSGAKEIVTLLTRAPTRLDGGKPKSASARRRALRRPA
jgi:hypothetical protein